MKNLKPGATAYLLDFEQKEDLILRAVQLAGREDVNVYFGGNSDLTYDSYCWTLSQMIDQGMKVDFAYIDGAHTLHHDGLAFALIDVLLKPGGVVCFDDYDWSIDTSISVSSQVYDKTNEDYTKEQQRDHQVARIVRQLVRSRDDYDEIVNNFAFRKRD